jgi:hypothetical protein
MNQIHQHPEHKRLFDEIKPLIAIGRLFPYSELAALAGVDVTSHRGRGQFEKFRQRALREWGVWFECERAMGYRVTEAENHPRCALAHIKRSKRQLRRAVNIATYTSDEGATAVVVEQKRQIAASAGAVLLAMGMEQKKIAAIGSPVTSDARALMAAKVQ